MIYNGVTYYYQKNLQGDVIRIVNSSGTQVVSYTYDAWGNIISTTGTLASTIGEINPIRYRSYYFDKESGLYYLNSRYYDSQVKRFVNGDDVGVLGVDQGNLIEHNLFSYCLNNPINMSDDTGQIAWWVGKAIAGALIDTAVYMIGSAITGQKITWAGVGKSALFGAITGVAFEGTGKIIGWAKTTIYANKAYKAGKVSQAAGKAVKVVGHYPAYTKLSTKLGVKPFSISSKIWNKMTKAEQWAANQKFLDRAIQKGSDFILATPYSQIRSGSYLRREVAYLMSKGYKLTADGTKLIKW